jgi:hypothetical protein
MTYEAVAHIILARYRNYVPFERQAAEMMAAGQPVSRLLITTWMANIANALAPFAEAIRSAALNASILSCANRPIRTKSGGARRLWIYEGNAEILPAPATLRSFKLVWFRATPDRIGAYARRDLAGFKGILQASPTDGYDGFGNDAGITVFGCWRQIARQAQELARTTEHPVMIAMLRDIDRLNAIEKELSHLASPQRAEARQRRSAPVLVQMRAWLEEASRDTFPTSRLRSFLTDILGRWSTLNLFVSNGALEMNGDVTERRLERLIYGDPSVFTWHRNADDWSATIYTILETCAANGVDEHEYLTAILSRLADVSEDACPLLPMPWDIMVDH